MNIKLKSWVISILITALSGCAFTTDRIQLQYVPQTGVSSLPGANNVVVATKVSDLRADKTKVSSKKNGFGIETAPIIATEDVTITLQRAIEQELQARGFSIDSNRTRVVISVDLTRFYNDHKMGFIAGDAIADLNMNVTVKSIEGKQIYKRQILAEGSETYTQLATGNNARLALNRALENGIKILFEDKLFIEALLTAS